MILTCSHYSMISCNLYLSEEGIIQNIFKCAVGTHKLNAGDIVH